MYAGMKYDRNGADPCLYFKWFPAGLIIWLSWIDKCMCWGPESMVLTENKDFMERFDYDDVGEVKEYVGCKIEKDKSEKSTKFTQPVMLQIFDD